ncbi:MAG: hypothetical protein ACRDZN_06455, partial [Acidimicrobiales bacterium]
GNQASTNTVNFVLIEQEGVTPSETQIVTALGRGADLAAQALASGQVTGDPANLAVLVNAATGDAVVVTGDATAVNASTLALCQTYEVGPAICDPAGPVDPVDPGAPAGPGSPVAPVVRLIPAAPVQPGRPPVSTQPAGDLPRTGSESAPLVQLGVALLAIGVALRLAAAVRRRRRVVTVPPGGSA